MSKKGLALGIVLGAGAAVGGYIVAKRHGIIENIEKRLDRIADMVEEEISKIVKSSNEFEEKLHFYSEEDALSRGINHMSEKEVKEFEERINMNKNNETESASDKLRRIMRENEEELKALDETDVEADIFEDTDDEEFNEPVSEEDEIVCDFEDDDVVADDEDFVTDEDIDIDVDTDEEIEKELAEEVCEISDEAAEALNKLI